ncbi:hypothetical protein [Flavobacteriaceae bacterium 14752]|uniref:hypothetical protein n=1 Tax=Mesohalobacter salilacus TaxID=2491711 RepID=UPI000F642F88|nr:hypothetical protein EIG84_02320 [Flavobacteriaceae bacterium 14752]
MKSILFTLILFLNVFITQAQVGIGTLNPDDSAVLDVESTTQGVLIPRMTTTERDAIVTPAEGLQVYNITQNTLDVFSGGSWKSFVYSTNSNIVNVFSLADLPTPVAGEIKLESDKMYVFSGMVDISPNYILMNGAGMKGTDPQKDIVISDVNGAVLRSVDTGVFIEDLAVVPNSSTTQAYNFSDSTGTQFCNIFSGASVIEFTPSLGVGQISGFSAVTFNKNFWNVTDGLKIGGNVGKFASSLCFITGISSGSGLEFLGNLTIDDIDLSNNYFIYTGQTGIKVNAGATIDRGRLTTNMFRGVATPLDGIDSNTLGWNMLQNTDIPDSRAIGFGFFNGNTTATTFLNTTDYVKVAGSVTPTFQQRFTVSANNRITYDGRRPIVAQINASINSTSPANDSSYTIAIFKNGIELANQPINTLSGLGNNVQFQLSIDTEIDLITNDFVEVFIRSNNGTSSLTVNGLQFNVSD